MIGLITRLVLLPFGSLVFTIQSQVKTKPANYCEASTYSYWGRLECT